MRAGPACCPRFLSACASRGGEHCGPRGESLPGPEAQQDARLVSSAILLLPLLFPTIAVVGTVAAIVVLPFAVVEPLPPFPRRCSHCWNRCHRILGRFGGRHHVRVGVSVSSAARGASVVALGAGVARCCGPCGWTPAFQQGSRRPAGSRSPASCSRSTRRPASRRRGTKAAHVVRGGTELPASSDWYIDTAVCRGEARAGRKAGREVPVFPAVMSIAESTLAAVPSP